MNRRSPRRIGVTGGLAAGKSTALALLRDGGWRTLSADDVARDLIRDSPTVLRTLQSMSGVLIRNGHVDRVALRAWVSESPENLRTLEHVLHPLVHEQIREVQRRSQRRPLWRSACEVPLLFEVGWERLFDHIIVVDAPAPLRNARALRRPGVNATLLERLSASQAPSALKRRLADRVIQTGLGPRALRSALRPALRRRRRRPYLAPRHRRALGDHSI